MPARQRAVWICLAVFFLTTAGLMVFEGLVFLFSQSVIDGESTSMIPLFFLFSGVMFFAGGTLFLLFFENSKGQYVTPDDSRINFSSAFSQLPQALAAIFLGALLTLPVFLIWGPNKHWALSVAAGCSGQETPPSSYNDLCQNLARMAIIAGGKTGYTFPLDGIPPLANALATENLPMVFLLIDQGANVNQGKVGGLSPMFEVVDDLAMFQLFVRNGGRVDVMDHGGRSLLWYASALGDLQVVKELIAMGNQVNQSDQTGTSPLMAAILEHHWDVAEELIKRGAHIDQRNSERKTALMMVVNRGLISAVEKLVKLGADIHLVSLDYDKNALHMAAEAGHREIAEILLKNGAQIDKPDKNGVTALMHAAAKGHSGVAELLLSRGADVNLYDNGGWSALHWNAGTPQSGTELTNLLIRYRANVHARGSAPPLPGETERSTWYQTRKNKPRDWTPLHLAAYNGQDKIVLEILQAGADPNALTGNHQSPLSVGSRPGGLESVLLLLNRGASANFPGQMETPLHNAAASGALDVARVLIDHGADIEAKNPRGLKAWDLAMLSVDSQDHPVWSELLNPLQSQNN
ncbi:MAG: hypothetical protein G3M70_03090 [Candidatus Nitronauta litoralis]|uniref:Ankyrin repeat domain-containing protein n=1 Tax=Candidatus Nitronauta litoralis TaxID=2705533 RepID=A0A7T0BU20_9BACT|nr:MAG: hypothetical protein G3M70_03090 [Candidatus Nitronauta litoralis]